MLCFQFTINNPEGQSARVSKITNDGSTRSGTGPVPIGPMATVDVKGLIAFTLFRVIKLFVLREMLNVFVTAKFLVLVFCRLGVHRQK